jgi:hypothetical protein
MWMYIQQSEVAVQTHEKWLKKNTGDERKSGRLG